MYDVNEDAEDILEVEEDQINVKSGALMSFFFVLIVCWLLDLGAVGWLYTVSFCSLFNSGLRSSWTTDSESNFVMQKIYKDWGRSFVEARDIEFNMYDLDDLLNVTSFSNDRLATPTIEIQNNLYLLGKTGLELSCSVYEPYHCLGYNIDQVVLNNVITEKQKVSMLYKVMLETPNQEDDNAGYLLNKSKYQYLTDFKTEEEFHSYIRKLNLSRDEFKNIVGAFNKEKQKRKVNVTEFIKTGLYGTSPDTFKQIDNLYLSINKGL